MEMEVGMKVEIEVGMEVGMEVAMEVGMKVGIKSENIHKTYKSTFEGETYPAPGHSHL